MSWRRLGLVFEARGQRPWLASHAALPVPLPLDGGRCRVYFAGRDRQSRSHVGYVELDLDAPRAGQALAERCVLAPGPLGHFDDHGVYASCLVEHGGRLLMYTVGWSPGARRPLFYSAIGLAVSEDGGLTFERVSRAPIMARSEHDPCLVTSPCVRVEDGRWRMWYVSGIRWEEERGALRSVYHVKYAESADGVEWRRDGHVCVGLAPGERNVARPCVLRAGDGSYAMWFAYDAGRGYRIGRATSPDGYDWERVEDEWCLGPAGSGWESDAVAYPWVLERGGRRYLLYNGNGFGRDGFGLAVAE